MHLMITLIVLKVPGSIVRPLLCRIPAFELSYLQRLICSSCSDK